MNPSSYWQEPPGPDPTGKGPRLLDLSPVERKEGQESQQNGGDASARGRRGSQAADSAVLVTGESAWGTVTPSLQPRARYSPSKAKNPRDVELDALDGYEDTDISNKLQLDLPINPDEASPSTRISQLGHLVARPPSILSLAGNWKPADRTYRSSLSHASTISKLRHQASQ